MPHPRRPTKRIFHFPCLSTSLPAGILKTAEINRKIAESNPAWNRDAEKFLTTNIEQTGPRNPSPRDEKEITVAMVLIESLGNVVSCRWARQPVRLNINVYISIQLFKKINKR